MHCCKVRLCIAHDECPSWLQVSVVISEPTDAPATAEDNANACVLAEAALEVYAIEEAAALQAAAGLGTSVQLSVLAAVPFRCDAAYRSMALEAGGANAVEPRGTRTLTGRSVPSLVAGLRLERVAVDTTRLLVVEGGRARQAGGGRRLQARASSKSTSGSGGARTAVRSATIAGQGWTTEDWAVGSQARAGPALVHRYLGISNVILGGVLLHQVSRCADFWVLNTSRLEGQRFPM